MQADAIPEAWCAAGSRWSGGKDYCPPAQLNGKSEFWLGLASGAVRLELQKALPGRHPLLQGEEEGKWWRGEFQNSELLQQEDLGEGGRHSLRLILSYSSTQMQVLTLSTGIFQLVDRNVS